VVARLQDSERAPVVVLIGVTLLVAAAVAAVAVHVTTFALDETLFKQSALHYFRDGFPASLFHDLNARGTSRLHPLLVAPIVAFLDGDTGVRVARAVGAFLFASASIPAYLLGRGVLRSPWRAVAAALLSVVVPWLALGTTLFTENLAYPGFLWTVLAVRASLRRPSLGRDATVVVAMVLLTCVRVQFAAVLAAYLFLIACREFQRARRRELTGWDAPSAVAGAIRAFPVSAALVVAATAAVAWLAYRHRLHYEVQVVLGSYSEIQDRAVLPSQIGLAFLFEVVSLALGVGLVPALVGGAWYRTVLGRGRRSTPERLFALDTLVITGAVWALALIAQNSYNGAASEERYYIYAVPFVWIGALASIELRALRSRTILLAGGGLALLLATIELQVPLTSDTSFLAPASSSVSHILGQWIASAEHRLGRAGLSPQDVLSLATLAIGLGVAWAWRAAPRARFAAAIAAPAIVQVALTLYAFAATTGQVDGVVSRTAGGFAGLAWIDRAVGQGGPVVWLNTQPAGNPTMADAQQRRTLFWNSSIRSVAVVPALGLPMVNFPMNALPIADAQVSSLDGRFGPSITPRYVVDVTDSPFLQLAGRLVAASRDRRLELIAAARPLKATWLAEGLLADGALPGRKAVSVRIYTPSARTVSLLLTTRSTRPAPVVVRIGRETRLVVLDRAHPRRVVSLTLCPGRRGVIDGELRVASRAATARSPLAVLASVRLTAVRAPCRSAS